MGDYHGKKFYNDFHNRAVKENVLKSVTLEVGGENNPAHFIVNRFSNFPFLVYTPNVGFRIKEVKCNNFTVWIAGSENERCVYASFYPRNSPTLGYLILYTPIGVKEFFYSFVNYEWIPATRNEYRLGLAAAGFKESTFRNTITLDINNTTSKAFYVQEYKIDQNSLRAYKTPPGVILNKVVCGESTIWFEKEGCCTYVNTMSIFGTAYTCFIFVIDSKNNRQILYFKKQDDEWISINKDTCNTPLTNNVYLGDIGAMDQPRLLMSSFRNRQDLRITSYASRVDNSKGDIILVHGIRSHFMSEFCATNLEWNFERIDFPLFLNASPFGGYIYLSENSNVDRYRHLFEHGCLDGLDAFEVLPVYEYRNSLLEYLNRLGYNVYGFDLQSQGVSESVGDMNCCVNDFKDYVNDLLQFIDIIKRDKFGDTSQTWNERVLHGTPQTDRKTLLFGFSMGSNIVIQAIQTFHKNARLGIKLVDGTFGISPMLDLDIHIDNAVKWISFQAIWLLSFINPNGLNPYAEALNYGENFEFIVRFHDPYYHVSNTALKMIDVLFSACETVDKGENIANYPKDLPTLFVHTKGDRLCGIKGTRGIIERHLSDSDVVRLVEFDGSVHYLTAPQSLHHLIPVFTDWFDTYG